MDQEYITKTSSPMADSIVGMVFVALIKGDVTACMNYVVAFISGKTLWYMPCCIVAEVLHFAVLKVSKNRTKFEVLYSAVLAVAGFGLSSFHANKYGNDRADIY